MNVTLREVYQTSADGERFWKMKEMFIKGNIVCFPLLLFLLPFLEMLAPLLFCLKRFPKISLPRIHYPHNRNVCFVFEIRFG